MISYKEEARDLAVHVKTLQNSWLGIQSKFHAFVLRKQFFALQLVKSKKSLKVSGKRLVVTFHLIFAL
jgi:hypothetical protein